MSEEKLPLSTPQSTTPVDAKPPVVAPAVSTEHKTPEAVPVYNANNIPTPTAAEKIVPESVSPPASPPTAVTETATAQPVAAEPQEAQLPPPTFEEEEALPDTSKFYLLDDPKVDRDRITAQARLFSGYVRQNGARIIPGHVQKILDLGCGEGTLTYALGQTFRNAEILGIDRSPGAVEQANTYHQRRPHLQSEIKFIIHDAEETLPGGPYDLIYLSGVLLHLQHPDQVLQRCWEALKPGGSIWIKDLTPDNARDVAHPHWLRFLDFMYEAMQKNQRDPNISVRLPVMLDAAKFTNIKAYDERYPIDPNSFAGRTMTSIFIAAFYNSRRMISQTLNVPEAELLQMHQELAANADNLRGSAHYINYVAQRPLPTTESAV